MNISRIFSAIVNESSILRNLTISRVSHAFSTHPSVQEKGIEAGQPQEIDGSQLDKLYKTLELELRGNDPAVLNSYAKFATTAGKHFDLECKFWSLRKPKHERFTMYKSVHIYKKHKAQYELRTYFTFVQFNHLTGSTCDTLVEYLQRNLPEGVALKTSKVELQKMPDYLEA